MRSEFTNNAPVSAIAATGACAVKPASHVRVESPAAAIVLAARQLPMMRQDRIARELILTVDGGYTPAKETTPSAKLGGFRGVPPRRRPV
jgi:hypothetical protein